VEVIKGPASLLYGSDALGGVMNFIPEALPTDGKLSGDYQVQLFSNSLGENSSLSLKGSTGNLSGALRLSQKSHADYLQGGGDYLGNSRFNEQSMKADMGYLISEGNFRLQYERSRENLGLVEPEALEGISKRGRSPELFYQQLNAQQVSSQNKLRIGRNRLDINGSFQQTELIHFGEPDAYELQMQLSTLTGEARLLLPIRESTQLIVGTQGMHQANLNTHQRETILLPDAAINNLSGFLFADQVFTNLHIQGGLRYDFKTLNTQAVGLLSDLDYRQALDKSYASMSGSLGLTWHPVETWYVRSNLATGYRTPNLAELTSNGPHEEIFELGDARLSPERSLEWDLSAHLHQTNLVVDLAAFVNRVFDFIHQTPTGTDTSEGLPIYQYQQADAVLFGGEADIHIHPATLPWLHLEQSLAWVVGKQDNGDFLPFIPATKLNTECRITRHTLWNFREVFAAVQVQTALRQNHPAPNESATAGYALLNLSLGGTQPIRQNALEWQLGVNNLTDVRYIDHLSTLKEVGKFNPGRNVMLSVKIPF
jgi:iron complex outermembrane recepter protein